MSYAKSIVIVDDENDLVNLYKEALEMDGFNVSAFTDPMEALGHIQKEKLDKYSLIISDFKMPKIDGYELCTKILNISPDMKIILMSAYDDVKCDISRFTFLSKPITIARLLKVIHDILDKKVQTLPNLERKYDTLYNIKLIKTQIQYR